MFTMYRCWRTTVYNLRNALATYALYAISPTSTRYHCMLSKKYTSYVRSVCDFTCNERLHNERVCLAWAWILNVILWICEVHSGLVTFMFKHRGCTKHCTTASAISGIALAKRSVQNFRACCQGSFLKSKLNIFLDALILFICFIETKTSNYWSELTNS